MEKAAIEITSDVDSAVSAHFDTSSMQTTLKTQAEEVFTKFCDEQNPEMINRLEGTAKEILTNDVWVTKHIQAIATDAVAYQKENLNDHINNLVKSNQVHKLITDLARTACIGHAAAASDSFATTKEEEDNNGNNNGQKNEEVKTMFKDAHFNMKGEVDIADKKLLQERTNMISKNLNKFEVKVLNVHTIPNTGLVTAEEATSIYTEIEDDCLRDGFPLTGINDLLTTKSCIPTNHKELPMIIETIGHSIHRRLMNIIPTTNTDMVEMIAPYKQDRDGYGALYTILRRTCPFMRPTPEGWGPDWLNNMSSSTYVTHLQHFTTESRMRYTRTYDDLQQSKEMLHRAAQSFNQPVALKLDSELSIWVNSNEGKPLPKEWKIAGIADRLCDYPSIIPSSSKSTPEVPGVKAFHQGGKSENNGYNRKKFELKNKVQCACCQLAGHTIGDQICRVGAQVKHIQDYSQRHEDVYEENAKRYESMNKTKVISRVLREDETITNMEELLDATEDRQNPYHETSGE